MPEQTPRNPEEPPREGQSESNESSDPMPFETIFHETASERRRRHRIALTMVNSTIDSSSPATTQASGEGDDGGASSIIRKQRIKLETYIQKHMSNDVIHFRVNTIKTRLTGREQQQSWPACMIDKEFCTGDVYRYLGTASTVEKRSVTCPDCKRTKPYETL